jgi:AAA+ superfamily predicted ATPase
MSLADILKFRYPIVWMNTTESERFIISLTSVIDDRALYVFDDFEGLTVWDESTLDFKIITVEKTIPFTDPPEKKDIPLMDFGEAFGYVFGQGSEAIFVIRNFHKGVEEYFNPLASIYNKYYRGLRFDDLEPCPITVLCLSAEPEVPKEIASMVVVDNFELPTESAVTELLTYVSSKIPVEDAITDETLPAMAKACRGMTEFDIVNTVFDLVARDGAVKPEEIDRIKYERLKAMSTLDIVKPKFDLDQVGGLDHLKTVIMKADWIRRNPELAKEKGVDPINKVLVIGLPGCGKSMICEAASKTLGLDLAKIGVAEVMTKWIGESERKMRETFKQIHALAPIACWIDELGRDFQGGDYDGGTTNRVHGVLLTGLQELPSSVALFAAANDVTQLPPEMLRAERFDKIMFVGYPSFVERIDIFKINLGADSDYDWEELSTNTPFFTGAEIVQLIKTTKFDCIYDEGAITTRQILEGVPKQKNRLWVRHRDRVKSMYHAAINDHEWASSEQFTEASHVLSEKAFIPGRTSAPRGITIK